ncbi:hypothetical protein GGR56DRAFT_695759 [Xylariaceae sp. FL0804]|nr:hypothetical protein GGR56DRAFT_695759 [Xylariaceae sp. FL0804]
MSRLMPRPSSLAIRRGASILSSSSSPGSRRLLAPQTTSLFSTSTPRAEQAKQQPPPPPPPATSAPPPSRRSPPVQRIPPESPRFVNLPATPQDQRSEIELRERSPLKGFLPTPRRIFSKRGSQAKATAAYLARSAPEPSTAPSPGSLADPRAEHGRRMAATRRSSLASGVRALWQRKRFVDRKRGAALDARRAQQLAAATAPERRDEVLTRGWLHPATHLTAVARDPHRFETAAASRARTASLEAARSEARRDALQGLYMGARAFIVDEDALGAEVDRLFHPDYYRSGGGALGAGANGGGGRDPYGGAPAASVWDAQGAPPDVAALVSDTARYSNASASGFLAGESDERTRTEHRQRQVAEELTGGKMEDTLPR